MQFQVHLIGVSFVPNILLYCANFRSSNHCACACDFQVICYIYGWRGFQDLIIFADFMILSDRPIFLLSIMCSTIFSSRLVLILLNKTVSLYFAFFCKFEFSSNLQKKAKDRLYVLFNNIRTNHDEKIVEPNMESRKTDLSDKIMKLAKIIKSWNPEPRKCRISPKNRMRMRNDYCS